jgi:competence protein ComEC
MAAGLRLLAEQVWIVWAPVALGAGILCWFLLPELGQRRAVLLAAAGILLAGLALGRRRGAVLASGGALVALGLLAADLRSRTVAPPMLYHRLTAAPVTGTLLGLELREGGARTRLLILRDETADSPPVRVWVTIPGPPPGWMEAGRRLLVPAVLGPHPPPMLPAAHDSARRAWFLGVSATGRATGAPVALEGGSPRAVPLAGLRADIARLFDRQVGGDAGAVATALVTGQQGQIAPPVLEAMRVAGLVHLLTVSGFHVGVAAAAAFFLARWTLALSPWLALRFPVRALAALAAGLAATFYALVAGAGVPAVRAAIIALVVALAVALGRNPLSIRLLALAATLVMLLRPEALMGPSFQLSFAAVLALILLADSRPGRAWLAPRREDGPAVRLGRWILALAASGLVVELALTPIAATHFGRSGLYGMVANMAAIPLTSFVVMPLVALTLLAAPLGLAGPAGALLRPAAEALIGIGETVAGWPGAQLTAAAVPLSAQLAGLLGFLMLALFRGPLRWLGLVPLGAGLLLFAAGSRPDLLVSPDGTHLGVVADGRLFMLRATRGGMAERVFREQANAAEVLRIDRLPGARCTREACAFAVGARQPLRVFAIRSARRIDAGELARQCADADLVVAPRPMPGFCRPRWLLLDREALKATGAVAIHAASRRVDSVAARAGDHPWSPSALPGRVPQLLGPPAWRDPLPE